MSSHQPFSPTRIVGLDLLRGITIVAMVVFHFVLLYYPRPTTTYATLMFSIGAFVPPLFIYLAGAGVWFFLQRYPPTVLLKRGAFLLGLTLLISFFIKGRFYFEWTMIQDIAVAYVLCAMLALVTRYRFIAGVGLYLASIVLAWVGGVLLVGEFPFLLYAPYFLAGYAFSALCPTSRADARQREVMGCIALIAVLGGASWLTGNFMREWLGLFAVDALWRTGAIMLFHLTTVYFFAERRFDGRIGGALVLMGRIPLTCYYIQQVLLRLAQRFDFRPSIISPEASHVLWVVAILGLIWVTLRGWRKFDYAFSLEWLLRRV